MIIIITIISNNYTRGTIKQYLAKKLVNVDQIVD